MNYNKYLKTNTNFNQSFLNNESEKGTYPNLFHNISITK